MINPILDREIKTKSRSKKMPVTISIYLGILALFTYAVVATTIPMSRGIRPSAIIEAFDVTVIVQLLMVMTVTPMLTATSISGERDRQTLDLMLCTDTSPWTIIFGKIYAAVSTVVLLILLSLPILSIIFILGGSSLVDIGIIYLYYIVSAFTMSTVSIYASTKYKKNITSIVMTYVMLFIFYVIPFILMAIIGSFLAFNGNMVLKTLLEDNAYIFISLVFGWNPAYGMASLINNNSIFNGLRDKTFDLPFFSMIPPWLISLVLMGALSAIMLLKAKKHLMKKS